MDQRAAASAETRRKIVDAAIELHAEKGVVDTSWPDIARRADVALGTVYRHFQDLETLVAACTSENATRTRPPGPAVLEGLTRPEERLARFVEELFGFYERSAPWIPRASVDRHRVPALDAILKQRELHLGRLVDETLGLLRRQRAAREATLALTSFCVWQSLTSAGLSTRAAAKLITDIAMAWFNRQSQKGRRER
jgi:AcrR family transcriptional regulator